MVVVSRKVASPSGSRSVSPKATRRRHAGKSSSSNNLRAVLRQQQGVDAQLAENIAAIERHLAHLHEERAQAAGSRT